MGQPSFRPGAILRDLDPSVLPTVMLHPSQLRVRDEIEVLITQLRSAADAGDLIEMQNSLFGALYRIDERRAQATRLVKRLLSGRSLPADSPNAPPFGDVGEVDTWELEVLVHERLGRQLRSVGDALAWHVYAYNRQAVMAMGQNQSPGPLVKRAGTADDETTGLAAELGALEELWSERRHFALLHDLTNCMRIGDLTEVEADGRLGLHEIKRTGRESVPSAQRRRMEHAIRCANGDVRLRADRDTHLVNVDEPFRSSLNALADMLSLARQHGSRGTKLPDGRALVATSLVDIMNSPRLAAMAIERGERARGAAIRRAGIERADHHLVARSSDLASRSPSMVPWGIYPIDP